MHTRSLRSPKGAINIFLFPRLGSGLLVLRFQLAEPRKQLSPDTQYSTNAKCRLHRLGKLSIIECMQN